MDVARLLREHVKLRSLAEALVDLVSTPSPCDFNELARRRWDLARMVHLHLAYEERQLFVPLSTDPRPKVRAANAIAKRDVEHLHSVYKRHLERWTSNEVLSNWPEFQVAVRTMVKRMIAKIDAEEMLLFPLLIHDDVSEPCWRPGMRNWAGDGVALQSLIKSSTAPGGPTLDSAAGKLSLRS